jgi:hypothetical protein
VIDCLVPFHQKDKMLKSCVQGIRECLPEVGRIVVVTADANRAALRKLDAQVRDEDRFVSGLTLGLFQRRGLSGWHYQQTLKLTAAFSDAIRTDSYLVVDADTLFLHPTRFSTADGRTLFFDDALRVKYRYGMEGYDRCLESRFSLPRGTRFNFITHCMLFSRVRVKEFLERLGNGTTFWKQLSNEEFAGFSEFEFYGQFMLREHSTEMIVRSDRWTNAGWAPAWFQRQRRLTGNVLTSIRNWRIPVQYASFHHSKPIPKYLEPNRHWREVYARSKSPLEYQSRLYEAYARGSSARAQGRKFLKEFESVYPESRYL